MELSNEQLIVEAIEINHAGIGKDKTLERYRDHLVHFSHYLASVHGSTFYKARRKQIRLFMGHLEKPGGAKPHDSRLRREWCKARGYPDGRSGQGWSASYRKSYLSAIKFLYRHFLAEDDLLDLNPAALESSPKIVHKRGYTPTKDEIKRLLEAPGSARKWLARAIRLTFSRLPPPPPPTAAGAAALSPLAALAGGEKPGNSRRAERPARLGDDRAQRRGTSD